MKQRVLYTSLSAMVLGIGGPGPVGAAVETLASYTTNIVDSQIQQPGVSLPLGANFASVPTTIEFALRQVDGANNPLVNQTVTTISREFFTDGAAEKVSLDIISTLQLHYSVILTPSAGPEANNDIAITPVLPLNVWTQVHREFDITQASTAQGQTDILNALLAVLVPGTPLPTDLPGIALVPAASSDTYAQSGDMIVNHVLTGVGLNTDGNDDLISLDFNNITVDDPTLNGLDLGSAGFNGHEFVYDIPEGALEFLVFPVTPGGPLDALGGLTALALGTAAK